MIAFVQGRVAAVTSETAVLEVGGFGVSLQCTPGTLSRLSPGEPARLAASLVVREDSLTLYGFADDDERSLFELVQTASGVGPRLAQAMLAAHNPAALRRAIATEDVAALTLVPGIGKKGAQRIVLELKDKIAAEAIPAQHVPHNTAVGAWREQLHAALLGLGWSAREADEAVLAVSPEAEEAQAAGETPNIATLLRSALRSLSRT
jgi:Holliday junction DNA helicase RuvA